MPKLRNIVTVFALLTPASAWADETDTTMVRFFSIWQSNAGVTREAVAKEYADHVIYYGKPMTNAAVYADKRVYIRQWPDRHYSEVPGSAKRSCDVQKTRCRVTVMLAYRISGVRGDSVGRSHVDLTLAMSDGQWKIVREAGWSR